MYANDCVRGRIMNDFFHTLGQILQLLGTLGSGGAVAGLGILAILHPEQITKWTFGPLWTRKFFARLAGLLLLLIAILILFDEIQKFINK